jgi:hypothetical protein
MRRFRRYQVKSGLVLDKVDRSKSIQGANMGGALNEPHLCPNPATSGVRI